MLKLPRGRKLTNTDLRQKQATAIYNLEMELRTFIVEQDIQDVMLAQLLNLLPIGVEVLWGRSWSMKDCMDVALALGLQIDFMLNI